MTENEPHTIYEHGKLYDLDVNKLKPNPYQSRQYFDQKTLDRLAESIKEHGLLHPILFGQDENGLFVAAGERRLKAVKQAGKEKIVATFTDKDPQEIALAENLQREDLTQIEFAEALKSLEDAHEYTQQELAAIIGKAESTVSEILSINDLSEEIRKEFRGNRDISRNDLLIIARKKNPEAMQKAYEALKAKQKAGKKSRPVRPWPERIMSGCKNVNFIMKIDDIAPLDALTRKSVIEHLEELQAETETLLQRLRQETTSEEGGGAGQNQPQG